MLKKYFEKILKDRYVQKRRIGCIGSNFVFGQLWVLNVIVGVDSRKINGTGLEGGLRPRFFVF